MQPVLRGLREVIIVNFIPNFVLKSYFSCPNSHSVTFSRNHLIAISSRGKYIYIYIYIYKLDDVNPFCFHQKGKGYSSWKPMKAEGHVEIGFLLSE